MQAKTVITPVFREVTVYQNLIDWGSLKKFDQWVSGQMQK